MTYISKPEFHKRKPRIPYEQNPRNVSLMNNELQINEKLNKDYRMLI